MARRRHHGRHKSATRMRPGGTIGSISVSPPSAQTPPRLPTAIVAKIKGGRAVLVMMLCRHGQGGVRVASVWCLRWYYTDRHWLISHVPCTSTD